MHVMLERRPLPPKLRLRMARDTAAGILYMHRRGIIHRDLKSLNLLITEDYTTRCASSPASDQQLFDTFQESLTSDWRCCGGKGAASWWALRRGWHQSSSGSPALSRDSVNRGA
jgi:serine/threonine protein kinase